MAELDSALAAWLVRAGLAPDATSIVAEPLTGGVASDIWRIDSGGRRFVIKRALAKLRVKRDWQVPVSRNAGEVAWLAMAATIVPDAVPHLLAHDAGVGAFAMEYLDPADHPVWKAELRAGRADPQFAAKLGRTIAAIHSRTASRPELADGFGSNELFSSIRLEPYLAASAEAHPDLQPTIEATARETLAHRVALVHGDISPKNILVGPKGPVLLDAECAWYGDPAFDIAFCLNHLLLKCLWVPEVAPRFLAAFEALADAYLGAIDWEPLAALEARAARLLPALFLARVDGKSPVEYLTDEADRQRVRSAARNWILSPPAGLAAIRASWAGSLAAMQRERLS